MHEAAAAAKTCVDSIGNSSPNSKCRAAARGTQPRRYSPSPHLERLAVGCRHLGCAAQEGLLNGIWTGGGECRAWGCGCPQDSRTSWGAGDSSSALCSAMAAV